MSWSKEARIFPSGGLRQSNSACLEAFISERVTRVPIKVRRSSVFSYLMNNDICVGLPINQKVEAGQSHCSPDPVAWPLRGVLLALSRRSEQAHDFKLACSWTPKRIAMKATSSASHSANSKALQQVCWPIQFASSDRVS